MPGKADISASRNWIVMRCTSEGQSGTFRVVRPPPRAISVTSTVPEASGEAGMETSTPERKESVKNGSYGFIRGDGFMKALLGI